MGADGFLKGILRFLAASSGFGNIRPSFKFPLQRFAMKRYKIGQTAEHFPDNTH